MVALHSIGRTPGSKIADELVNAVACALRMQVKGLDAFVADAEGE